MSNIVVKLHPCTGSVEEKGCYRATVATGRGSVMGFDEIVKYAFDRGYIFGIKEEAVKSVVRGIFDSIIAGIKEDGRTRSIDDYLSVSLRVRGKFEDEHDEFDPARHRLALTLAPLKAFRPSFRGVEVVNPDHRRQFRLYSVRAADVEGCRNRHVLWRRDIVVQGTDFPTDDSMGVSVRMHDKDNPKTWADCETRVLSRSETELRLAWPAGLEGEAYSSGVLTVAVWRIVKSESGDTEVQRREIKASVSRD